MPSVAAVDAASVKGEAAATSPSNHGVIDQLQPEDNGRFVDYRGETMPW